MAFSRALLLLFAAMFLPLAVQAQTQKALTNADILNLTREGLEANLIVKDIEANSTDFDVSPQSLIELKNAGVAQSVMEAMLAAHAGKPAAASEAAHAPATTTSTASNVSPDSGCDAGKGCLLRDGTDVPLVFAAEISSKTAHEGDPVEFFLDQDLKVGEKVVAPKGAHAVATVTNAKRAGMMGKPGELNVQLQYLIIAGNHLRLRGTKGKEGDSKTGATVALTVLFGPIGLIKHGSEVKIPQGTALKAYSDQDVWLAPVNN